MCDVEDAILDAWNAIAPRFAHAPNDLPKRLARRTRSLARPPRAWCLAIRASDTRIESFTPNPVTPHSVTLDRDALRRLCAPVVLRERHTLAEAAAKLGVRTTGLLPARVAGVFEHRYLEGLEGRWGKPRPLIHTHELLDPATRGFVRADPVWSDTAESLVDRLPQNFPPQTLTRIPHFQPRGHGHRDTRNLHPEHPLLDPQPRKRKSLALPPPPPDPLAWYMWKGDVWMGYDSRNPYSKKNYERRQRRLELARAAAKRRRRERPALSLSKGSLDFRGLRWRCPHCGRAVNVLFLPLPPINLLAELVPPLVKFDQTHALRWHAMKEWGVTGWGVTECEEEKWGTRLHRRRACPEPVERVTHHPVTLFACEKCHRVRRFSRCDPNAWNEIIAYLSGGLLYGREVKRPAWFPHAKRPSAQSKIGNRQSEIRKLPYTPRPNRAPSQRRPQIERLLLSGRTFRQIAADLGLVYGTVLWYAQQVYKQHNVRSLRELLTKHGHAVAPTKKEEVRRRVVAGQSVERIAREMGISPMCVYNQAYMLHRACKLPSRAGSRAAPSRSKPACLPESI